MEKKNGVIFVSREGIIKGLAAVLKNFENVKKGPC